MHNKDDLPILSRNLYLAQQVKDGELFCAQKMGIGMYQLMEKAGHTVFECMLDHFPNAKRITFVAGRGNNGGDAYIAARFAKQSGFQVQVYSFMPELALTGDAQTARQSYLALGGKIEDLELVDFTDTDLIVDGLLGIGFKGKLKQPAQTVIRKINDSGIDVIAIDLPSGLNADTGSVQDVSVNAHLTVTFVAPKVGLFTGDGVDCVGHIIFAGLGIGALFQQTYIAHINMFSKVDEVAIKQRRRNTNKGSYEHLVCIGGNKGMPGAIFLAAKAALRSGVGKVSVITHPDNVSSVNVMCPELMVLPFTNQFDDLVTTLEKADAIVIGPGLGQDQWAQSLLEHILKLQKSISKPLIIDADGLNLLAKYPTEKQINDTKGFDSVLTPHPLEAARLLDCDVEKINAERVSSAKQLARLFNSHIVLKGAGSIVANEVSQSVNRSGNPGMATAGMGDVLAGIMGAFVSNKENLQFNLNKRVKLAVYVHGLAGDFAAKNGEIGIMATDVIKQLPMAIKRCTG